MDKTILLALILVVMVTVSAVQAVQLTQLKGKLENNEISTKRTAVQSSPTASAPQVPSSLDNLPQMVGGC